LIHPTENAAIFAAFFYRHFPPKAGSPAISPSSRARHPATDPPPHGFFQASTDGCYKGTPKIPAPQQSVNTPEVACFRVLQVSEVTHHRQEIPVGSDYLSQTHFLLIERSIKTK
jgi:hypothetical protein